jgi:hypothetical protein
LKLANDGVSEHVFGEAVKFRIDLRNLTAKESGEVEKVDRLPDQEGFCWVINASNCRVRSVQELNLQEMDAAKF